MRTARLGALLVLAAVFAIVSTPAFGATVRVKSHVAQPGQFPPSVWCRCHELLLMEWSSSMHSKALKDPLFTYKVAEADKATGGKMGPFCRRCHGPVATMTGQDGAPQPGGSAAESIVCSFCHQIVGTAQPIGNVSQLLDPSGVMRAQIKDPQSPHSPVYSAFHTKSALCGGCHNVNHPVNGVHLESTFTEWSKSPQAKLGVQCQDCHMSESPPTVGPSRGQAAAGGPQRSNIYHMTFAGAQVGLGDAGRATALLRSAAKVEVAAPQIVAPGSSASMTVTVTNVGAGHYLPTGLTEVRRMRLQVVAIDANNNETEIGSHVFGTELKDAKGNHPVELWYATGIAKDDRIPPDGSVTDTFKLTLPTGADAVDVDARLLYQSVPDELAKAAGVANPITTMAETTTRVFASEAAKAADTGASKSGAGKTTTGGSAGSNGGALLCGGCGLLLAAVVVVALYLRSRGKAESDSDEPES